MRQITAAVFVLLFYSLGAQRDTSAHHHADSSAHLYFPVFDTGGDETEAGASQQDISALLQGSRDVFMQLATFQFAAGGFRLRGLPGDYHRVLLNGIELSNAETGYSGWSTWGGLNDITKHTESAFGNAPSRYCFAGPGGYTNINATSAAFRKGSRVSYSTGNRIFRHRLTVSHSTGMLRSGWAFTFAASVRRGDEVNVPGTYFNAWSGFISVQRRMSYRHELGLTAFIAPLEQGRQNAAVREVFTLTGDPDYNSAWGYQNGAVRNSKVSKQNKPTVMLTHQYRKNASVRIINSLCFQGGSTSRTMLNYADASNPRPDYYRYLPSYFYQSGDSVTGHRLTAEWQQEGAVTQVQWDEMINANRSNLYSAPSSTAAINTTETRARYILENQTEKQSLLIAASTLHYKVRRCFFSAGLAARSWTARKYKIAEDLLGATFWIDEDPFASGENEIVKQNDITRPGRQVRAGEQFGYDYSIHVRRAEAWTQAEWSLRRWELFASASASWQQAFRIGYVANGKFPESSKGKSETLALPAAGVRGGATYKINGRNYFSLNALLMTAQPSPADIFISPQVRNNLVEGLTSEKIRSAELSYNVRRPGLRCRLTTYFTSSRDQLWVRTFWHDETGATVNMIMRKVRIDYSGLEAAIEKQLGNHSVLAGVALSQSLYRNRPELEAWQDNTHEQLFSGRKAYLDNYRAGNSPQLALGLNYKFQGRRSWFISIGGNYFDHIYTQVNPVRRTEEAAGKFSEDEQAQSASVIAQERLPAWFLANATGFKSFRLKNNAWVGVSASVMNILNQRTFSTGFEQLRWDPANPALFPAKYVNNLPRTFLLSITYNM